MQKLLLVAISSLFMVSCNSDLETVPLNKEKGLQTKAFTSNVDFQIVNYGGENCFQFKNDSVYNEIILKIAGMSDDEAGSLSSGLGFVSQQQIMEEADKEQVLIVDAFEAAQNRPWPYQEIKEFKQKYEDVFMFNPLDSTDFIANFKVRNPMHRNFANRQGLFLIGDSVVQCPVYTAEEFFGSPIKTRGKNETTDYGSINRAESKYQIPGGDFVKVRAIWNFSKQSVADGNFKYIDIDFLSQKKKILWKKHNSTIRLRVNAQASGRGLEIYDKAHSKFDNQNNREFMINMDTYDKINVNIGRFGETPKPTSSVVVGPFERYYLSGKMSIWSSEIPETNKGLGTLKDQENW